MDNNKSWDFYVKWNNIYITDIYFIIFTCIKNEWKEKFFKEKNNKFIDIENKVVVTKLKVFKRKLENYELRGVVWWLSCRW